MLDIQEFHTVIAGNRLTSSAKAMLTGYMYRSVGGLRIRRILNAEFVPSPLLCWKRMQTEQQVDSICLKSYLDHPSDV